MRIHSQQFSGTIRHSIDTHSSLHLPASLHCNIYHDRSLRGHWLEEVTYIAPAPWAARCSFSFFGPGWRRLPHGKVGLECPCCLRLGCAFHIVIALCPLTTQRLVPATPHPPPQQSHVPNLPRIGEGAYCPPLSGFLSAFNGTGQTDLSANRKKERNHKPGLRKPPNTSQ